MRRGVCISDQLWWRYTYARAHISYCTYEQKVRSAVYVMFGHRHSMINTGIVKLRTKTIFRVYISWPMRLDSVLYCQLVHNVNIRFVKLLQAIFPYTNQYTCKSDITDKFLRSLRFVYWICVVITSNQTPNVKLANSSNQCCSLRRNLTVWSFVITII